VIDQDNISQHSVSKVSNKSGLRHIVKVPNFDQRSVSSPSIHKDENPSKLRESSWPLVNGPDNSGYNHTQNHMTDKDQFITTETMLHGTTHKFGRGGYEGDELTPYKSTNSQMNMMDYYTNTGNQMDYYPQYDLEQWEMNKPFNQEEFHKMIIRTYHEFYGKFKDQFDPDEMMEVVIKEELTKRFDSFFENTDDNVLTL
jgi:hypothetical protein